MDKKIRNVAIIAHVDHGKTTLVDKIFKQSGLFRDNQAVAERLMDSNDLERGITIMSKTGGCTYNGYNINIIDTPGHADFGGEVERVLSMADGALFLVDAAEGPMPQSYFVLKKAIAQGLKIIVVVNKIDKPQARSEWVVDQVFDLMVKLNAPDNILDFPILYASAKNGYAIKSLEDPRESVSPVLDAIIEYIPSPKGDPHDEIQLLVSTISYSSFLGRLAVGKIRAGQLKINQPVCVANEGSQKPGRITKIYKFKSNEKYEVNNASAGDIVAIAGIEGIRVGDTITDPANPVVLPGMKIDPPTLSMNFIANDSPFSGQEGEFVTSNHLKDRLNRETLSDVALHVESIDGISGYKVSGRGELHLSILIEKMRREGYEFQVSRPTVIFKTVDGKKLEPYEEAMIDVPEDVMGAVIETMGIRKGQLLDMVQEKGMTRLKYKIPTRGLIGYISEFMTLTKGMGVLNTLFLEYGPYVGEIKTRQNGVMICNQTCTSVGFALFNLQERGVLFIKPAVKLYEGQIIGEYSREDDLVVNPAKAKKLTNMRSSGADDAIALTPHRNMSLEECIAFIEDDELVEFTPKSIRIRKKRLTETARKKG